MKDFFLVSSVSVLAKKDYSVKAFSLGDGDSWCVFPSGLPGVAAASLSICGYRRIIWCWTYGRVTASISGYIAYFTVQDRRLPDLERITGSELKRLSQLVPRKLWHRHNAKVSSESPDLLPEKGSMNMERSTVRHHETDQAGLCCSSWATHNRVFLFRSDHTLPMRVHANSDTI